MSALGNNKKPWQIISFPENLRREFVADCHIKGVTVSERVEKMVKRELGKKQK